MGEKLHEEIKYGIIKNMGKAGCLVSTIIITIVRGSISLVSGLFFMIAHFFHATGLFFPFLYGFFGLMMFLFCGLDFTQMNTDLTLYILGLVLSAVCMIIWAIRYIILKPNAAYNERQQARAQKREQSRQKRQYNASVRYPVHQEYFDDESHYAPQRYQPEQREKPRIYRSRKHPELIVYDYSDRFELFHEENGELIYYKTEFKDQEDYE